jgi:hypothetical protein
MKIQTEILPMIGDEKAKGNPYQATIYISDAGKFPNSWILPKLEKESDKMQPQKWTLGWGNNRTQRITTKHKNYSEASEWIHAALDRIESFLQGWLKLFPDPSWTATWRYKVGEGIVEDEDC